MTYIPRREITALIPNKFEAIRVLALECRRLNDEFRAQEAVEIEGKITTMAVKQMLEGKVTYYDAKERREQERSEAMLSAAEGLLDIAEPMIETDFDAPVEGDEAVDAPAEEAASDDAVAEEAVAEPVAEPVAEETVAEPVAEEAAADEPAEEAAADAPAEKPVAEPVAEEVKEFPGA